MEDGGSPYIGLIVLLGLVIMHTVFCGFLQALENINESNLEKLAKGNKKAEILLKMSDVPLRSLHTIQFLITGLDLFVGSYVLSEYESIQKLEMFLLYWCIIVIVAMFTPTKVAAARAEGWGLRLCGVIQLLNIISYPFVKLCEWISDVLVRLCGVDPKNNPDDVTEEEIISMVNEGHEQGVLLASEAEMIHNIFEFGDKEAKDIMTHRKNIMAIDGNMTFAEAADFMSESRNSRFPVYIDDIDNIIGILHIKEALQICLQNEYYNKTLREIPDLIRNVEFIPETRNINALFKEMQSQKSHMVVVVDEYGQTAGIVAMEDILEEIVGNILDEHDEDEVTIQRYFDGSFVMSGMAEFEDVADTLGLSEVEKDAFETLNGFLISRIDRIPNENDRISINAFGYCFKVLKVENKIIQKVQVTKIPDNKSLVSDEDCSCQES